MVGLVIAFILGFPVVFLAIGFYGVSRKRAEEGREHLEPPLPVSIELRSEPVHDEARPMPHSSNSKSLPPMKPAPGGLPS